MNIFMNNSERRIEINLLRPLNHILYSLDVREVLVMLLLLLIFTPVAGSSNRMEVVTGENWTSKPIMKELVTLI